MNAEQNVSSADELKAKRCLDCPVCRQARKKQKGLAYWFVKHIEPKLNCPYCQAYERVFHKKAYEP